MNIGKGSYLAGVLWGILGVEWAWYGMVWCIYTLHALYLHLHCVGCLVGCLGFNILYGQKRKEEKYIMKHDQANLPGNFDLLCCVVYKGFGDINYTVSFSIHNDVLFYNFQRAPHKHRFSFPIVLLEHNPTLFILHLQKALPLHLPNTLPFPSSNQP